MSGTSQRASAVPETREYAFGTFTFSFPVSAFSWGYCQCTPFADGCEYRRYRPWGEPPGILDPVGPMPGMVLGRRDA